MIGTLSVVNDPEAAWLGATFACLYAAPGVLVLAAVRARPQAGAGPKHGAAPQAGGCCEP
ncbi:MAG TPA: hypothetical protein PKB06_02310 [Actinotalea sp.]|nr:hypothetical protein [Actinotalea sp.]